MCDNKKFKIVIAIKVLYKNVLKINQTITKAIKLIEK